MSRTAAAAILAAAAAGLSLAGATAAGSTARIVAYPRVAEPASTHFAVRARIPGGPWVSIDTYRVTVGLDDPADSSLALFSMPDRPVEVEVTALDGTMRSAAVEPASAGIEPSLAADGSTATFVLDRPRNVSFEADGDRLHNLQLFANPPEPGPPAPAKGRHVIAFSAGLHDLPGDHTLQVPSDTTVYLAPGALVRGALAIDGAHDVVVRGDGIVDPSAYFDSSGGTAGIFVDRSTHVGVRDVTILRGQNGGLTVADSTDVALENVKEINSDRYGDGLDVASSSDVLVDGCFFRTSDDSIAVWATNPWIGSGSTRDLTVRSSVLWPDVAHGILVGPYGRPGGSDVIANARFENVDILEQDVSQSLYQGAIGLEAGDSLTETGLAFENVRIARVTQGQALNVRVYRNPNENETAGTAVRDVLFRNVSAPGAARSELAGYSATQTVSDVDFQNLRVGGRVVLAAADGGVEIGPYATGVAFEPAGRVETWNDTRPSLAYRGRWVEAASAGAVRRDVHRADARGASLTIRFTGRQAILTGGLGPDGGTAELSVDGKPRGTVDTYAARDRTRAPLFDTGVLPSGEHTLVLRVSGKGDALSGGTRVTVDAVQILSQASG